MKKAVLLSLLCIGSGLYGQEIPHDLCTQAKQMEPGDRFGSESNSTATIEDAELPETQPVTCIKTFENDLWYQFKSKAGIPFYEIIVNPTYCDSPAGLQTILIQAEECSPESFIYQGCVNPYAEREMRMVVQPDTIGLNYYIYVDGYDGTICSFSIELIGHERDPRGPDAFRNLSHDYDRPPPSLELEEATVRFENNEALIEWTAKSQEDTRYFLIQLYYPRASYGKGIGSTEAINTVGVEVATHYSFRHQTLFRQDEEYCYRVVSVSESGIRAFSEPFCGQAQLNEDFFVSPVHEGGNPGQYLIKFVNYRKQDLLFKVLNAEGEEQKRLLRPKEPKGDGTITIDMSSYAAGSYYLEVIGKSESFKRLFTVP